MNDRTEEFLRLGLASHERPLPSAAAVENILRSVRINEHARSERALARRRFLLRAYWAIACLASAWILWSLPWPAWQPSAMPNVMAWLVPMGGAVLLWSASLLRFTRSGDGTS